MKHLSKIFMIVLITILSVNFTCDAKTKRHQRQNSPTRVQQHFTPNDAAYALANAFAINSNGIIDYFERSESNRQPVFYVRIDCNNVCADFEWVTIWFNQICDTYNNVSQTTAWRKTDASSIFTVYKVDIRDVIVSYLGNVDGFLTILFSAAQ